MAKLQAVVREDRAGGGGYFAGLMRPDGTFKVRSLNTKSKERALAWARQGACHGWNAHHKPCKDCEVPA